MGNRSTGTPKKRDRWAIGRYTAGWLLASAAIVVAVAALLESERSSRPQDAQRAKLVVAAERAGCVLRTDAGGAPALMLDVSKPPTFGPARPAAADGVYTARLPIERIVGALRRGAVVVQYRGFLDGRAKAALRLAVSGAPGVIVAPDGTGMPYRVAATAWRRVLGCPSLNPDALSALRVFRDRYRGVLGPEAHR